MTPAVVAFVALWSATDGPRQAAHDYAVAHHLKALQDLWVEAGVMEERERSRFFVREWSERYDTEVMVDRANRTTATTPPFSDRYLLPPSEVSWANREVCRRYLKWLDWIRPWATPQERVRIDVAADYVTKAMAFWSLATTINSDYCYDSPRLLLAQLRDLVGEENYKEWRWPTPLPPWVDWDEWSDPPEPPGVVP